MNVKDNLIRTQIEKDKNTKKKGRKGVTFLVTMAQKALFNMLVI